MRKNIIRIIIILFVLIFVCIIISVFPKKIYFRKNNWNTTSYVVLHYGKYLGKHWGNGTYSYYQIKGLDADEWIAETYSSIVPMNSWTGTVYQNKKSVVNPIKQWSISRILISSNSDIKQGKINYSVDNQITDKTIISNLLNGSSETSTQELTLLDFNVLLVFDECPNLAFKCLAFQSKNKEFFIMIDNNYYSANFLRDYLEN